MNNANEWLKKHPIVLTAILLPLVLLIIIIIFAPSPSTSETQQANKELESVSMLFDVPSLFNKNIDQVKAILGKPSKEIILTEEQKGYMDTWEVEFTKDNYRLSVGYDIKTGKVTDFFVDINGNVTETEKDRNILAKVTNVTYDNPSYEARFVPVIGEEGKFTGLSIKPKQ